MGKANSRRRNRASTKIKTANNPAPPKAANDEEGKLRPTIEREMHNVFRNTGNTTRTAVRIVPVIETMLLTGKLTQAQFDALDYYRDQAHRAEDDCAQCSTLAPERMMGGGGTAPGSKIPVGVLLATPAILETGRLERELASHGLLDIARAVAVNDVTLTQWCIAKHGGRERYRDFIGRDGKPAREFIAMVPIGSKSMADALFELRYASGVINR